MGISMSVMTLDTGIGYKISATENILIPAGVRLGSAQLTLEALGQQFQLSGQHVTPFVGLSYRANSSLTLGFESRLPVYILASNDDDEEDDEETEEEDDGGSTGLPIQYMGTLTFHF